MATTNLKSLIGLLNPTCKSALETAASQCINRGHYEVTVEHYLLTLLDDPKSDLRPIFRYFERDIGRLERALNEQLELFRTGNTGRPVFSPTLIRALERSWMIASVNLDQPRIRSGIFALTLLENPDAYGSGGWLDQLQAIPEHELHIKLLDIIAESGESAGAPSGSFSQATAAPAGGGAGARPHGGAADDSALARYAMNYTQRAREDGIDPVFGRDREIRQMIDILARRRKNNPIIVGEAGVGKTALVEGLAVRIVEGDVPDVLKHVELIGLDLGLLQAGAGVKGEFEARLKKVIDEVKASPVPIILFIDEAHTLIGAGAQKGGSDAANMLKPALARGELRTIAATTWSEYKKYFEKDAALSRRFQLVKLDEPGVEATATMLRGLRERYEAAHGVIIRDDALRAAAELGSRYISGRQHPDKGIDLVDTAAARVRVALTSKPAELDDLERSIATLERERAVLERDAASCAVPVDERLHELAEAITKAEARCREVHALWEEELEKANAVLAARKRLDELQAEGEDAEGDAEGADPEADREAAIAEQQGILREALTELRALQGRDPLISVEVTPEVIGRVVSDWTGIPLGKMIRDEAGALLHLEDRMGERIKGQAQALEATATRVRAAKAGLKNPKTPIGVFLFVGPSGVGKTETALAVADLLFGGERFLTTINMSEFQEKHTVSRLIGSPPGYVGYGEGGVLTEAVRQRPYSCVLLDEVEKAHPEVLNLFYQVFDKGMLADGEGRVIDFKDTVIFLTSNLATDVITKLSQREERPDPETLAEKIRPILSKHFKPALLARMTIVPFYTIGAEVMADIVRLKLGHVADRLAESQKMRLDVDEAVVTAIADRCTVVETGARNIDHIINGNLLPRISTAILEEMAEGAMPDVLWIGLDEGGEFAFRFGGAPEAPAVEEAEQAPKKKRAPRKKKAPTADAPA